MQPITNLDSFDLVGVRNDGGLDLVISCRGPLDASTETLRALRTKITNYLQEIREARNPSLFERYECAPDAPVRIIISCAFSVHPIALQFVEEAKQEAHLRGAELVLEKTKN